MANRKAYSVYCRNGFLYGLYDATSETAVLCHIKKDEGTTDGMRVTRTSFRSAPREEFRVVK